jgi:predicted Rossmann fold flavoprotein
MSEREVAVVGGGAAGFFAAITCAEARPGISIAVLEKSSYFLAKVRISGGGRCNVTHACFDPRQLSTYYPRGGSALLAPFHSFQPTDTMEWFESRGVRLKTEEDGRVFPVTDSSQTIIDCLTHSARAAGVELIPNYRVEAVNRREGGGFELSLANGEKSICQKLMLATGGCRVPAAGKLPVSLGHSLEPPVPSLFTFHVDAPWLRDLAGITVPTVDISLPGLGLREQGALLITHVGLSGPAVLKLSARAARELHQHDYKFSVRLNWLPHLNADQLGRELDSRRAGQASRLVINSPVAPLPARLWESLVLDTRISRQTRWAELSRGQRHGLVQQLQSGELQVTGKTLNKDEFVTCGGVRLNEVNFKTMESKICPGLFFGGELLDIDGLTGGFNFQSAWTTGWITGNSMARSL